MQLLQYKEYAGTDVVSSRSWRLKSSAPDGATHISWLSSRWLDVATGCAVQPTHNACTFAVDSQLLQIGDAPSAQLTLDSVAGEDCSEDEYDDEMYAGCGYMHRRYGRSPPVEPARDCRCVSVFDMRVVEPLTQRSCCSHTRLVGATPTHQGAHVYADVDVRDGSSRLLHAWLLQGVVGALCSSHECARCMPHCTHLVTHQPRASKLACKWRGRRSHGHRCSSALVAAAPG